MSTTATIVEPRPGQADQPETLPETRAAWAELNTGAGFSTSDRVDLAAAWFDARTPVETWHHPTTPNPTPPSMLVRTDSPDGRVWVDPASGEIVDTERATFTGPLGQAVDFARNPVTRRVEWHNPQTGDSFHADQITYRADGEKRSAPLDYTFTVTPGTVRVRVTDPRRHNADPSTVPRWTFDTDGNKVLADGVTPVATAAARSAVREFTRKSRSNLIYRVLATPWADYLTPGDRIWFVTLTAPPDWRRWLGDHDQAQRAMKRFEDRLADHTGQPARFFWKREFQRRGAPHWHAILIAPDRINNTPIRQWMSTHWYEAVGSSDPKHLRAGTNVDLGASIKAVDPKRLALYFAGYSTKEGGKEYQHRIPDGYESPETGTTGRWWGAKGLPAKETTVRVTMENVVEIQRLLRDRQRAQRGELETGRTQSRAPLTKPVTVRRWTYRKLGGAERTHEGPPAPVFRTVRRRAQLRTLTGVTQGCTVYANDAPNLAVNIARHLNNQQTSTSAEQLPIGHRGPAQKRKQEPTERIVT